MCKLSHFLNQAMTTHELNLWSNELLGFLSDFKIMGINAVFITGFTNGVLIRTNHHDDAMMIIGYLKIAHNKLTKKDQVQEQEYEQEYVQYVKEQDYEKAYDYEQEYVQEPDYEPEQAQEYEQEYEYVQEPDYEPEQAQEYEHVQEPDYEPEQAQEYEQEYEHVQEPDYEPEQAQEYEQEYEHVQAQEQEYEYERCGVNESVMFGCKPEPYGLQTRDTFEPKCYYCHGKADEKDNYLIHHCAGTPHPTPFFKNKYETICKKCWVRIGGGGEQKSIIHAPLGRSWERPK